MTPVQGTHKFTEKSNLPIHFISHFRLNSRKCALSWELNLRNANLTGNDFYLRYLFFTCDIWLQDKIIQLFKMSHFKESFRKLINVLYLFLKISTFSLFKLIKLYQSNLTYIIEVLFLEEIPFFLSIKQS